MKTLGETRTNYDSRIYVSQRALRLGTAGKKNTGGLNNKNNRQVFQEKHNGVVHYADSELTIVIVAVKWSTFVSCVPAFWLLYHDGFNPVS